MTNDEILKRLEEIEILVDMGISNPDQYYLAMPSCATT